MQSSRAINAKATVRGSAGIGLVGALLCAVSLGACTGISAPSEPVAPVGLGCVDDSKRCIDERAVALKSLLADPSRKWVREPSSSFAYASGVRMYAFKQKKRELTCDELAIGRREADAAGPVLRGPSGAGLTPAQISRGVMFAGEVGRELNAEGKRRCGA